MVSHRSFVKLPRVMLLSAALGGLVALAACSNPVETRGDLPDPASVAKITPGKTDKAQVTQLLGSPSSVAEFDADTWYYISQKTRDVALHLPEHLDQRVLAITFDDKGMVRTMSELTMADAEHVTPNPDVTPSPGREFTVLEQLIGNFGRFNADNKESNPGGSTPGGGPM